MKNLLRKEFRLGLNPQVVIFVVLAPLFLLIPSMPGYVGFIYLLSGLATIFPRNLADKDITYTAMLPIRKGDVVASKVLFVVCLEAFSLLLAIPTALLKDLVINPLILSDPSTTEADVASYNAMAPSLGSFGFLLLALGVYAIVLFPWYYKNPEKVNWPQIVSLIAASLILGAGIGISYVLPGMHANEPDWLVQSLVFVGGFLAFVGLSILAERRAEKAFEKVDL
jgi:ABC-2 type transport system permease protein